MRFKIKLFSLLIVLNISLISQINIYKPFPESFAVWKLSCWCNINNITPSYNTFRKFQVSGDTTINAVIYKKVNCSSTIYGNPAQPLGPYTNCFAYRNDAPNKKVYYLNLSVPNPIESLWYDFNLIVGDTLKNTFSFTNPQWVNASNQRRIVSSIDSVSLCGIYYKRFNFNCLGGFNTALIEGVGFVDHFITTNFGDCPFEPPSIYTTVFSTCDPTALEEFESKKNSIRLYPNPVNLELKIVIDFAIHKYEIFDNGGCVTSGRKISENESIDVSKISQGLYVLKLEDEYGNFYYSKFIKE